MERYSSIAAVLSVIVGIASIFVAVKGLDFSLFKGRQIDSAETAELRKLESTLSTLQLEHSDLRKSIAGLLTPGKTGVESVQVRQLRVVVERQAAQLSALEDALSNSPAKALAVPLMRKDIDGLQERYKGEISSMHDEIGRVYTQTQWFIGLMITIALGVFALALGNLRSSKVVQS